MSSRERSGAGKIKIVLIVLCGLLVAGGAGGLVAHRAASDSARAAGTQPGDEAADKNAKPGEAPTAAKEGDQGPDAGPRQIVDLGEFLLNVDSAEGLRYVKCDIAVQVAGLPQEKKGRKAEEKGPSLTSEQEAWAKDAIIRVFARAAFDPLRTEAGREKLRKDLAKALQDALQDVVVTEVLFTTFVMQ